MSDEDQELVVLETGEPPEAVANAHEELHRPHAGVTLEVGAHPVERVGFEATVRIDDADHHLLRVEARRQDVAADEAVGVVERRALALPGVGRASVEHRQSVRADHLEDLHGAVGGPVVHGMTTVRDPHASKRLSTVRPMTRSSSRAGTTNTNSSGSKPQPHGLGPAECQGEEQVAEPHDDQGQGQDEHHGRGPPSPTAGREQPNGQINGLRWPAAEHRGTHGEPRDDQAEGAGQHPRDAEARVGERGQPGGGLHRLVEHLDGRLQRSRGAVRTVADGGPGLLPTGQVLGQGHRRGDRARVVGDRVAQLARLAVDDDGDELRILLKAAATSQGERAAGRDRDGRSTSSFRSAPGVPDLGGSSGDASKVFAVGKSSFLSSFRLFLSL